MHRKESSKHGFLVSWAKTKFLHVGDVQELPLSILPWCALVATVLCAPNNILFKKYYSPTVLKGLSKKKKKKDGARKFCTSFKTGMILQLFIQMVGCPKHSKVKSFNASLNTFET